MVNRFAKEEETRIKFEILNRWYIPVVGFRSRQREAEASSVMLFIWYAVLLS